MSKKTVLFILAFFFLASFFYFSSAHSQKGVISKEEASCYQCHEEIKSLKVQNKHASLSCAKCHSKLA
ncbi:MAG: ammonia-forming cytochrome c nitrite reductase subunit c552, partial [Deltaproteobacteria bacterium]|nr:ammonia-forming cytochrome c nitrite reductase subunit c552 [Deltaproteobacteria bacterium]